MLTLFNNPHNIDFAADALWSQRIGAAPELRPGDEAAAGALRRWSLLA